MESPVLRAVENMLLRHVRQSEPLSLLCAVSGGEDSHALLHALSQLSTSVNVQLTIAHFNHRLRAESFKEAQFVARLAAGYGIPCIVEQAALRDSRENVEAWARRVRYEFLEQVRRDRKCDFLVTAHHANDQVETFLFRLISGRLATDAFSIAGEDAARRILRPLLSVPKAAIEEYVAENRLAFVLDSSNTDLARTRNRLRHSFLPLLAKEYNPRILGTLGEVVRRLRDDEEALWSLARREVPSGEGELEERFFHLPKALQWRVVKLIAESQLGAEAGKLGYRSVAALVERICAAPGEPFVRDLGFGIRVRFRRGLEFSLSMAEEHLDPEPLIVPGEIRRNYSDGSAALVFARVLTIDFIRPEEAVEQARSATGSPFFEARAFFDLDRLGARQLVVRERRDGDRLRVWKRGERKVKKLFQEQGLMRRLRDSIPLVEFQGEIVWIPGVARSEVAPVVESTTKLLELSYRRSEPLLEQAQGIRRGRH